MSPEEIKEIEQIEIEHDGIYSVKEDCGSDGSIKAGWIVQAVDTSQNLHVFVYGISKGGSAWIRKDLLEKVQESIRRC